MQVNIIPIIAKADTISKSELHKFKIKIMSELVSNGVQIYQFPTDDDAVAEINSVMNVSEILILLTYFVIGIVPFFRWCEAECMDFLQILLYLLLHVGIWF